MAGNTPQSPPQTTMKPPKIEPRMKSTEVPMQHQDFKRADIHKHQNMHIPDIMINPMNFLMQNNFGKFGSASGGMPNPHPQEMQNLF